MTPGPLPHKVEVRTLAAREVELAGSVSEARMPRLKEAIVAARGPAEVTARCFRDEEGRYVLDLAVTMPVDLACQRCLGPMPVELKSHSQLVALWTDDQAAHLPSRYDALVTDAESDLWQVVEDELLLAMPAFSYHEDVSCGAAVGIQQPVEADDLTPSAAADKENPFSVLAALKGNSTDTD